MCILCCEGVGNYEIEMIFSLKLKSFVEFWVGFLLLWKRW